MEQTLANSEEQILTLSQTIEQLENKTTDRRRTIEPDLSIRDDEQADRIEELEQKGKYQMKELALKQRISIRCFSPFLPLSHKEMALVLG